MNMYSLLQMHAGVMMMHLPSARNLGKLQAVPTEITIALLRHSDMEAPENKASTFGVAQVEASKAL